MHPQLVVNSSSIPSTPSVFAARIAAGRDYLSVARSPGRDPSSGTPISTAVNKKLCANARALSALGDEALEKVLAAPLLAPLQSQNPELIVHRPGLLEVQVDSLDDVSRGAHASAWRPDDGVWLIVLERGRGDAYRAANVPHEFSHLMFRAASDAGLFPERKNVADHAYHLHRDELIARCAGAELPLAYLWPNPATMPEALKPYLPDNSRLNDLYRDLHENAMRTERDPSAFLVGSALEASTFGELEQSAAAYRDWLASLPSSAEYQARERERPRNSWGWA